MDVLVSVDKIKKESYAFTEKWKDRQESKMSSWAEISVIVQFCKVYS